VSSATRTRLLVVEDSQTLRRGIAQALRESGAEVEEEESGDRALQRLRDPDDPGFDVVVTDLRLPGADGVQVVQAARERDPRTAAILMTAYGSIETAVEAMKLGAFDFLEKPFDLEQLEVRVEKALEHGRLLREVSTLRAERAARWVPELILGHSAGMRAVLDLAERVAPARSTVLITGETGTGKELIAGLIHARSPRASGPFVKVNCAALPDTLLESELFGHERGAFTGADRRRVGRFEQASGGTLFLDEVGDMASSTQAKLLRVLQEQEFVRLGGTRPIRTDVRILAATNQDLERGIREGRFREDLYFRLNVFEIRLPPLRERREDLEPLAKHFAEQFFLELGRPPRPLSAVALQRLREHAWPGNVRELRNAIERSVLLADGRSLELPPLGATNATPESGDPLWCPELPPEGIPLRAVERQLVLEALRRSHFVQKEAARLLHVSRRKLNYMIQRMGITHPRWRRNRKRSSPNPGEPANLA
jgi:DNA-binding NtrC family response regulator